MAVVLLTAGCAGTPAPSATTPAPTRSAATAAAATISGPMTGQELLWIQAVTQLLPKMNKVFNDAPANLISSALAAVAGQLRGCDRAAARIGPPSARLQPVYELLKQACRAYDKGAKCFEDAARIGIPIAGSADEKKFNQKVDCGFAASGNGSKPLAQAQVKASELEAAAG
jgi:hypothetical protein